MATLSAASLYLAGFALAHAAWSVSDTAPDELLCPMAVLEDDEGRRLIRFEAETQERAIESGKASLGVWQQAGTSFAFAREGQWRPAGPASEPEDLLLVDFWAPGMDSPQVVLQPFRRAGEESGFALGPMPQLVLDGQIILENEARSALDVVLEGVQSHDEVAPLWHGWTSQSAL